MYRIERRWYAMPGEKILGECLAAFQLCGGSRRAKNAQTSGTKAIHHACHQWDFRPDHGQCDQLRPRQGQ